MRADLCIDVPDVIESIFIELNTDNTIVGCVYRPPGADVATFTAYVDTILSKINKERKKCYIAGDYNHRLLRQKAAKYHIRTQKYTHKITHRYTHTYSKTIKKTLKEHHIKQEWETYR